jgi:hypothetical protein
MVDPEILTDTIVEWFATLNYEYMLLHIIICYGLYYSKNMSWIVQRFSPVRKKGIARGVWLSGGFLALMEVLRFIPFAWENSVSMTLCVDKVISIFHSYILIQVFVDPIVNTVHRWLDVVKKTSSSKD